MSKRPIQFFTKEYLDQAKKLTPTQIAEFVTQYQAVVASQEGKTKPISLRIPEELLKIFKTKSKLEGKKYQSQIVELMRQWVRKE